MKNPYPYSDDNKRYQTMNYYFKHTYGHKVAKVPLNAGFTCPNRDGTKGMGGCTFCSALGSGDSILHFQDTLSIQYQTGLERMRQKWPHCLGFAYFQSFSNTYAPLDVLRSIYDPFFNDPTVTGVAVATRADCLEPDVLDYLAKQASKKEVWIELGLQSIHEKTMKHLNRCHGTQIVWDQLAKIRHTPIKTCVHLMNSLPGESKEDMIDSATAVAAHHPDAIKIHMLHLLKGTQLAKEYEIHPFPILSLENYVDIVVSQLEVLPPDMIIERLTGDGLADELILPTWTIKKTIVLNEIDKRMARLDTYQGKYYCSSKQ